MRKLDSDYSLAMSLLVYSSMISCARQSVKLEKFKSLPSVFFFVKFFFNFSCTGFVVTITVIGFTERKLDQHEGYIYPDSVQVRNK